MPMPVKLGAPPLSLERIETPLSHTHPASAPSIVVGHTHATPFGRIWRLLASSVTVVTATRAPTPLPSPPPARSRAGALTALTGHAGGARALTPLPGELGVPAPTSAAASAPPALLCLHMHTGPCASNAVCRPSAAASARVSAARASGVSLGFQGSGTGRAPALRHARPRPEPPAPHPAREPPRWRYDGAFRRAGVRAACALEAADRPGTTDHAIRASDSALISLRVACAPQHASSSSASAAATTAAAQHTGSGRARSLAAGCPRTFTCLDGEWPHPGPLTRALDSAGRIAQRS